MIGHHARSRSGVVLLSLVFLLFCSRTASSLDPNQCKLPNKSPRDDVALGFPRLPYRLNPVGTLRWAILVVDFPDSPATHTPTEILAQLAPAADLYGSVSYGRLTAELVLGVPTVVRMPLPSTAYSFSTFESHREYLRNATDAACEAGWEPAHGGWDSVVAMAAAPTPSLGYGPAFCAVPGAGYTACTSSVVFLNSATSGNDFPGWGFKWFNHENSHTMGLVDLYAFSPGGEGEFTFTGEWGLMGDISGAGPEFFGWERWLLGWLQDTQVECVGGGGGGNTTTTVTLAPLSASTSGSSTTTTTTTTTKLIVVPTPSTLNTTGLVVEYRTPMHYDSRIPKAGLLVYAMDTSLATGEGPLRVLNAPAADNSKLQAPLAVGESVTFEGVRVEHVATDKQGNAIVAVTVAPPPP
jgi:M6 family metalloprotease-like protein